jgi:hypothetical protein
MLQRNSRLVLDTLLPALAGSRDFDQFWADFERTSVPAWRWSFRAAVFAANWIAPLLIHRMPPLARYDRPTREQMLAALGASRSPTMRQMLATLKTLVSLYHGADPVVRAAIGYPNAPGAQEPRPAGHDG